MRVAFLAVAILLAGCLTSPSTDDVEVIPELDHFIGGCNEEISSMEGATEGGCWGWYRQQTFALPYTGVVHASGEVEVSGRYVVEGSLDGASWVTLDAGETSEKQMTTFEAAGEAAILRVRALDGFVDHVGMALDVAPTASVQPAGACLEDEEGTAGECNVDNFAHTYYGEFPEQVKLSWRTGLIPVPRVACPHGIASELFVEVLGSDDGQEWRQLAVFYGLPIGSWGTTVEPGNAKFLRISPGESACGQNGDAISIAWSSWH